MTTPIRSGLEATSPLIWRVQDGLAALERADRAHVDEGIRADFDDSLDLDEAMREAYPEENRWDYLLGYGPGGRIIGLEPHSARADQVSVVIAKKKSAQDQLRGHLKRGASVAEWFWVASGKVDFADTEKSVRKLEQNGIQFVRRTLLPKHLRHLRSTVPPGGTNERPVRR